MQVDQTKLDNFLAKVIADLSAGYGGVMVSLGHKLGLYKAMAGGGPVTSSEVASQTGCAERYVREWLNSQTAGGYVNYHPVSKTYELTPEQEIVLADDTSPLFIPPAWQVPASMWFDEDKAVDAFKTGKGVSWGDHDHRLYCGVATFYRNAYQASLVSEWLPTLEGVVEKLQQGAKVADIGCGHGHSALIMAKAFPNSNFYGFDTHVDSIEEARVIAKRSKLEQQTQFKVVGCNEFQEKDFDLICYFDCLHDMGRPLDAVKHATNALSDDGTIMLVEPFANDRVEDNINDVGRLYYAASTTLCCAHAISENGSHVLGAQAGQEQLEEIFLQAGCSQFRRAAETPFNLILEARK